MLAPWAVRPPSTRSSPISSAISSSLPKPFWKEMNTVLFENNYHLLVLTHDLLHLCEHVPGASDGLPGVGRLALHKHDVHSRLRLGVRGGSHLKRECLSNVNCLRNKKILTLTCLSPPTPTILRPLVLMVSTCSAHTSTRTTSRPFSASRPPKKLPMAPCL